MDNSSPSEFQSLNSPFPGSLTTATRSWFADRRWLGPAAGRICASRRADLTHVGAGSPGSQELSNQQDLLRRPFHATLSLVHPHANPSLARIRGQFSLLRVRPSAARCSPKKSRRISNTSAIVSGTIPRRNSEHVRGNEPSINEIALTESSL